MSRHLIWVAIFKDDIALKSCKMFDTTEVKKEKKIGIYIIFVPKNKELPGIRNYQKKGTWQ